eukprot:scaffold222308_cov20-Tisochrysis_lutea.AAC.1
MAPANGSSSAMVQGFHRISMISIAMSFAIQAQTMICTAVCSDEKPGTLCWCNEEQDPLPLCSQESGWVEQPAWPQQLQRRMHANVIRHHAANVMQNASSRHHAAMHPAMPAAVHASMRTA